METRCGTIRKRREEFAGDLLRWFARAMRPLPWRERYDPYAVWISEIMLQQTQMERGVAYFNAWMRRFPDVRAVADADENDILAAWEGLGYYSRARNLHKAAKRVVEKHGGVFPDRPADIRALPGVGEYTAGAIASIAFNIPEPAVDANVARIFARLCDIDAPIAAADTRQAIAELVAELTPPGKAREFCQAMMELGALVCGKNPRCGECPVAGLCEALRRGTVGARPVKKAAPLHKTMETAAAIIVKGDDVLIRRRPAGGLWPGLWEFPGGVVEEGERPEQALERHLGGIDARGIEKIGVVRHSHTVWRVTLHGYLLRVEELDANAVPGDGNGWTARSALANHAFPAGHRKLLARLGWKSGA